MTDGEETKPPDHEKLVEQAEQVLDVTRATLYDVASGEAQRLQDMLDEAREADND